MMWRAVTMDDSKLRAETRPTHVEALHQQSYAGQQWMFRFEEDPAAVVPLFWDEHRGGSSPSRKRLRYCAVSLIQWMVLLLIAMLPRFGLQDAR
jgi:hypothetical protein